MAQWAAKRKFKLCFPVNRVSLERQKIMQSRKWTQRSALTRCTRIVKFRTNIKNDKRAALPIGRKARLLKATMQKQLKERRGDNQKHRYLFEISALWTQRVVSRMSFGTCLMTNFATLSTRRGGSDKSGKIMLVWVSDEIKSTERNVQNCEQIIKSKPKIQWWRSGMTTARCSVSTGTLGAEVIE